MCQWIKQIAVQAIGSSLISTQKLIRDEEGKKHNNNSNKNEVQEKRRRKKVEGMKKTKKEGKNSRSFDSLNFDYQNENKNEYEKLWNVSSVFGIQDLVFGISLVWKLM